MKKLHILTLLVSMFLLTNVASASIGSQYFGNTYVLNQDSADNKGVKAQDVTVTIIDANSVKFDVVPKLLEGSTTEYAPHGYFRQIDLPLSLHINNTTEGNGNNKKLVIPTGEIENAFHQDIQSGDITYEENTKLSSFSDTTGNMLIFNAATLQVTGQEHPAYYTIYVDVTPESTFTPGPDTLFGAHVSWDPQVYGIGSALFSGSTTNPLIPKLKIVKELSSDNGATWSHSPITVPVGSNVYYKFTVTNIGEVPLSDITLKDDPDLTFIGTIPSTLAKGGSFTVTAGPIRAATGENSDTATATGKYNGQTLTVTDTVMYNGIPPSNPQLSIVKKVSSDGSTWSDDPISVVAGSSVYYKFTVSNTGNVPLSDISLKDDPDLTFIGTIPSTLAEGGSFTVTAGPITVAIGENTDTATATGKYNGQTLTVTDTAKYIGTPSNQVPEFPSLVLPVAAILGILFIFGRHKKD